MSAAFSRPGPHWVEHAVLWHLHPLGFLGAPATRDPAAEPVPRLRGLVPWLDHLVRLGANLLLLGPVFASETHGYDTTDHVTVDPRLGTGEDLDHLLAEAHVRDMVPARARRRARRLRGARAAGRAGHDEPGVADHVVAVMDHWSARGVDGWRLVVGLHVGDVAVRLRLPGGSWRVDAGPSDVTEGTLRLPAHGWVVLAPA